MKRVIVESPYAGTSAQISVNVNYAQRCLADCLKRGEAPFASHLLYTQDNVLDDTIPTERELGIQAGFVWRDVADKSIFYIDLGITKGMKQGIQDCIAKGREIEFRALKEKNRGYAEAMTLVSSSMKFPDSGPTPRPPFQDIHYCMSEKQRQRDEEKRERAMKDLAAEMDAKFDLIMDTKPSKAAS